MIELELNYDELTEMPTVDVPNFGCCKKKKIDALLWALEHESIGMQKYNCLKEIMYSKNLWNKI